MKSLTFAFAAVGLALTASAMAQGPAMKAENGMKMESQSMMSGSMSGEKKDAMKPMAMKTDEKKPIDAMSMKAMKAGKDMKH